MTHEDETMYFIIPVQTVNLHYSSSQKMQSLIKLDIKFIRPITRNLKDSFMP